MEVDEGNEGFAFVEKVAVFLTVLFFDFERGDEVLPVLVDELIFRLCDSQDAGDGGRGHFAKKMVLFAH